MKRICLGKIVAAHGVKGLVKIMPYGEDYALLEQVEEYKIILKNPLGKFWLAEVEGVTDRSGAEALAGTELCIDRDRLPAIETEHTFYAANLVGLKVVDTQGNTIGNVLGMENFGAGDLLEIRPASGEPFYLPFTKDNVPAVQKNAVTVVIPEGLL